MTENWAYSARGRLINHDIWDWFGRSPEGQSKNFEGKLFDAGRHIWSRKPHHIIGFDGNQWLLGYHAYPKDFLDHERFPPDLFNYELNRSNKTGRPLDFFHGYQSETSAFPDHVPAVDAQEVARLHEQHIIPLWEQSRNSLSDQRPAPKIITSYEALNHGVPLSEYFPPEAIEALKTAHSEGNPIAIHSNPETKEWSILTEFHKAPRPASPPPINPANATRSSAASQEAIQTSKELTQGFKDLHPAGKIAIVGGSVALASLVGYWVFKTMHQRNTQRSRNNSAQMH